MKKEYIKPIAEYLDLCTADEIAGGEVDMSGLGGEFGEVDDPFI